MLHRITILGLIGLLFLPHLLAAQEPSGTPLEAVRDYTGITAWHEAGFDGIGAKVGIIDVGFGGINNLSADFTIPEGTDPATLNNSAFNHGTLVFEVVHSLAPGAEYYLFQLNPGGKNVAQAIDWMIAMQVGVVVYSALTVDVPLDGTNYPAQQVGRLADNNIVVIVPAGNHGISFVSEIYKDTNGDGWHEFEWGYPALWAAPIQTEMFGESHLRWQDVFTSAQIDLDLYIFTEDRSALWDAATELQKGRSADWPYEDAFYPTQAGVPVYIGIRAKTPGSIPDGTRYYLYVDDTLLGYSTPSGSIIAPADSPKVITVGAIEASEALWQRSARGPTWDGRIKPDVVAPTRLLLTSTNEVFTGTSASAPIVAAAAAITRGAFPNLNEVEVRHWLVSNAVDLGEPGPDNDFGVGRLWLPPPAP